MENNRWYRFSETLYCAVMGACAVLGVAIVTFGLTKGVMWMSALGAMWMLPGAFLYWKPMRWAHRAVFSGATGLSLLWRNDSEIMLLIGGCWLLAAMLSGCVRFAKRKELQGAPLWRL